MLLLRYNLVVIQQTFEQEQKFTLLENNMIWGLSDYKNNNICYLLVASDVILSSINKRNERINSC